MENVEAHGPVSLEEENPVMITIQRSCAHTQSLDQFLVSNECGGVEVHESYLHTSRGPDMCATSLSDVYGPPQSRLLHSLHRPTMEAARTCRFLYSRSTKDKGKRTNPRRRRRLRRADAQAGESCRRPDRRRQGRCRRLSLLQINPIQRPAATTPTQIRIDTNPAIFPFHGIEGFASHSCRSREANQRNQSAWMPPNPIRINLIRNAGLATIRVASDENSNPPLIT